MTALLFVCAFLPFIKHTQNAMSVQINRAPSPSTSQSSVTWHHLTNLFHVPCPSSSFPVCQLCSCGFCTAPSLCGWAGRNLVVLASASSPFSWRGHQGHSHSTVLCGHIYSLWDRFRVSVTIFTFFKFIFIVGRIMQLYDAVSDLYYAFQSSFTSWKTDSFDAPVVYIVRNRYT